MLSRQDYPGGYTLLRLGLPQVAACQPGHALSLNGVLWPILQRAPKQGWVDCLRRDAPCPVPGTEIAICGPCGEPFDLLAATPRALLLADNDGLAEIVFLARTLRDRHPRVKPFALFELTPPLPFRPQPSKMVVAGLPAGVIGALPLLEDWAIPSRIACPTDEQPGCLTGTATDLVNAWLDICQGAADVTLFACGHQTLLTAVGALAERYRLSWQIRPAQR